MQRSDTHQLQWKDPRGREEGRGFRSNPQSKALKSGEEMSQGQGGERRAAGGTFDRKSSEGGLGLRRETSFGIRDLEATMVCKSRGGVCAGGGGPGRSTVKGIRKGAGEGALW